MINPWEDLYLMLCRGVETIRKVWGLHYESHQPLFASMAAKFQWMHLYKIWFESLKTELSRNVIHFKIYTSHNNFIIKPKADLFVTTTNIYIYIYIYRREVVFDKSIYIYIYIYIFCQKRLIFCSVVPFFSLNRIYFLSGSAHKLCQARIESWILMLCDVHTKWFAERWMFLGECTCNSGIAVCRLRIRSASRLADASAGSPFMCRLHFLFLHTTAQQNKSLLNVIIIWKRREDAFNMFF